MISFQPKAFCDSVTVWDAGGDPGWCCGCCRVFFPQYHWGLALVSLSLPATPFPLLLLLAPSPHLLLVSLHCTWACRQVDPGGTSWDGVGVVACSQPPAKGFEGGLALRGMEPGALGVSSQQHPHWRQREVLVWVAHLLPLPFLPGQTDSHFLIIRSESDEKS